MIQKEVLHGGRKGKISKEEDKVIRPGNKCHAHTRQQKLCYKVRNPHGT